MAKEVQRKYNSGKNQNHLVDINTKKVEEDSLSTALPKISQNFKKDLQAARLEKKLTQAQLAQMINEKHSLISDYESGDAIPNSQIIQKLQRALGVNFKQPVKKPSKPIET